LFIYPIKSAAGIAIEQSTITTRGLEYDRRWMVVGPDGTFMTQRKFPKMALITVKIQADSLVVQAPDMEPLVVPLTSDPVILGEHEAKVACEQMVEVWGDRCLGWSMGEAARSWFSDVLKTPCDLVYMPDTSKRSVDHGKFGDENQVSFADAYPFLLISEASLDDLNQRLDQPVLMNRFRPNLVVSGCDGFAEDSWKSIQVGNVSFQVSKPCSRCVVTTVDQSTGNRSVEPLKTLATYRHWDGQIWFGQNLIHEALGKISVGDRIQVL
ncbi:MAG: MOSC N-terminal beta barrel domain-containing protein, partial [Cyanobacteria bacterium P01_A01_bin.37]